MSQPSIRDTLFGDMPIEDWPPAQSESQDEVWQSFIRARNAISAGRTNDAIASWRHITLMQGLESRHYAQAWHFLRSNGQAVPESFHKQLLGVVLEVAMDTGCDFLAAYPERTARYYNFSGAAVIWDHPSDRLDSAISQLLQVSQEVLNRIGPWDKPRLPLPGKGMIRVNFLSPAGLHFGQGPFEVLAKDPMAGPVIHAGTILMQKMIELPGSKGNA